MLQDSDSPVSTLPRSSTKRASSPTLQVMPAINQRPDLICDMVDDSPKSSNVRSLAEAIEEEVI